MSKTMKPSCVSCGDTFSRARKNLGYKWCMPCGEGKAKKTRHTIVPMAKSNYVVVTDLTMLSGLNKYASQEQTTHYAIVTRKNRTYG